MSQLRDRDLNPALVLPTAFLIASAILAGFTGGFVLDNALDKLVDLLLKARILF